MSEHYEPSYYEIALTGRQVLAAFVILLVCLVAAFFSGVWVGRGGTGEAEAQPTEVVADAGPGDDAAEEEAPPPDEDLEELSFFEGEDGAAAGGGPRRGSGPDGPDGDRGESPRREPSGSGGDAPGGEPSGSPRPASGGDGGEPGRDSGTPPARPAPAEPPPPAPAPPAEANPSRSLATGDIVVQVFSSSEEDKARDVLDRLRENDFRAFLSPVADGDRTLFRVRVGPFEHMEEARAEAERLRERLGLETWITQ